MLFAAAKRPKLDVKLLNPDMHAALKFKSMTFIRFFYASTYDLEALNVLWIDLVLLDILLFAALLARLQNLEVFLANLKQKFMPQIKLDNI